MKSLICCLMLAASVMITVKEQYATGCPQPEPARVKNKDGTYRLEGTNSILAVACWTQREWREEWTDYPEKGGTKIREIDGSNAIDAWIHTEPLK